MERSFVDMRVRCTPIKQRFQSEDGFTVTEYAVKGISDLPDRIVARGKYLPNDSFFDIILEGEMVDDEVHGPTFEVSCFETSVKRTKSSVIGYLSSGIIKGVGESTAKAIFDKFGCDAPDIIARDPTELKEVAGIGEKTLDMMMKSYFENETIHGLMEYLGKYKTTVRQVERIVEKFASRSLEIVKNDVYHLCDIQGFGFLTVDNIAKKMGHPLDTFPRVKAAAIHTLKENRKDGHLFMEPKDYIKQLKRKLNHKKSGFKYKQSDLSNMANKTMSCDEIVYANKVIYLTTDYYDENNAARLLAERLLSPYHEQAQLMIPSTVISNKVNLSKEQCFLIKIALYYHTFIVTGGPGTGKTAVLGTLLKYCRQLYGKNKTIALCAPTGRAARRMSAVTGYPAETIHRKFRLFTDLAEFDDYVESSEGYIEADIVIVDEASMVGMKLFNNMLSRLSPATKLIIVGDPEQLASVEPGNVLREMLSLADIPSMCLTQVFRQKDGTCIAQNAKLIKEGETELIYDDSFMFIPAENEEEAREKITSLYLRARNLVGAESVQVLSPVRKKGACCTNRLNRVIQAHMQREKTDLIHSTWHDFQVEDLVIQNKNKEGINNGDMGEVIGVTARSATIRYNEYQTPITKTYRNEELKLLELAYSLTAHKSQGSEYPIIIFPVLEKHKYMLKRNVLYTAITRGIFRVILVGSKEAIKYAITHEDSSKRNTFFALRIKEQLNQMKRMMLCDPKQQKTEKAA